MIARLTRINPRFLSRGALLTCALALPATAAARTAHVHAGPGPAWVKKFEIPSGAHVKVGSCQSGWGHHDWCKVSYRGKKGFIHEGALKPFGKHAIVAPIVTTAAVKLRANPGSAATVLMRLDAGAQVDVAHCSKGWLKGWCRVNHNGHSGFIEASSLRRD
jgi:uncharacterized protein YraI